MTAALSERGYNFAPAWTFAPRSAQSGKPL